MHSGHFSTPLEMTGLIGALAGLDAGALDGDTCIATPHSEQ